ncbi:MAG: D-alanine transaminase [Gammaproteobacteria bacterium]|nr:MAG: D-alanine transaminase [Gammaproteobacteria bacterium]TND06330.1 MAG: D-alanine transaminase [Gammaproteobacteria bacterium]
MNIPTSTCYLNGEFLPLADARIPVMDRGFIFGDGVYEVIPVYNGRAFRLAQHLDRLGNSLAAIRIDNPLAARQWQKIIGEIVDQNGNGDQSVYVQITRGVAPRDHAFPNPTVPTVFVTSSPLKKPTADMLAGVAALTLEDIRWQYCHIKAITLLANILLRQQAIDAGCIEAILTKNGLVTEGAASNVFVVTGETLVTPPKGPHLLPGITRDVILDLARANGIRCAERDIGRDELVAADEIWLTSSTREILPVTVLDGRPVGNGRPGPLWTRVLALYQQFKQTL